MIKAQTSKETISAPGVRVTAEEGSGWKGAPPVSYGPETGAQDRSSCRWFPVSRGFVRSAVRVC